MYCYEDQKFQIFTDEGQRRFLKVRDRADKLLEEAGAFKIGKVTQVLSGMAWEMMAHIDRLVELGEIREITSMDVAGQDRVFVRR